MICTLIRAAEINEQISALISRVLEYQVRYHKENLISNMVVAAFELGHLAKDDLGNLEIYTEMANTMTKIRNKI